MCLQGGRGGGAHLRALGVDTVVSRLNFNAQLTIPLDQQPTRCILIPYEIPQLLHLHVQAADEDLLLLVLAMQLVGLALRHLVLTGSRC